MVTRTGRTVLLTRRQVRVDLLGKAAAVQTGIKGGLVHTELTRVPLQVIDPQLALPREHRVVQLPELPLLVGAIAGLRRLERLRMVRQRVVLEHQADVAAVCRFQLLERAGQPLTERTLSREVTDIM